MKKLMLLSFILLAGCAPHSANTSNSFYAPDKQRINREINNAALAQQQYQTGLQSQSTYFRSANFQMLPNTIGK